jgi:hypothetical protein
MAVVCVNVKGNTNRATNNAHPIHEHLNHTHTHTYTHTHTPTHTHIDADTDTDTLPWRHTPFRHVEACTQLHK